MIDVVCVRTEKCDRGNAMDLQRIAAAVPSDTALCIFHPHVANQMPEEAKQRLLEHVEAIGKERDVFHLYNHINDWKLHLDYYMDGEKHSHVVAETDGHGRWFCWELW
jgi:hypothetical protein